MMRCVLRRVAPALAAGAIALSTTVCPIKAAAESGLVMPTYDSFVDWLDYAIYEAPENVWLTTSGLIEYWALCTELWLINQNEEPTYRITSNQPCPVICGKFLDTAGVLHPVTIYGGELGAIDQLYASYAQLSVYHSDIFTVTALCDSAAQYVQVLFNYSAGFYSYSYIPYGERGTWAVTADSWFTPTEYTVRDRTTMTAYIRETGDVPTLYPANFGLYFSPDNLSGYPLGVLHGSYTMPEGNPMQPAQYYETAIKPLFADNPEVQPYLVDMPQNGDVPTFSAPAIPAFSMPYPDFSAFNVGFWWQFVNTIVTACGAQSLVILCLTVGIGVMVVTRFGGGS